MKRKRDYKVLLFDLDGTLVDSKPGIVNCIKLALDTYGIEYSDDVLDQMVGPPFRVSMKQFCQIDDMDFVEKLIAVYRGEYEVDGWKACAVYDGIVDLLVKLRDDGFVLAVATSKPIKFTNIMLNGLDLSKYFDYIGGATADSSRDTKSDVINFVLSDLGVEDLSSVLMIGDRLYDIEGAKKSGVDSAGVLWGYGNLKEFEEYGADYVLPSIDALYSFLTE